GARSGAEGRARVERGGADHRRARTHARVLAELADAVFVAGIALSAAAAGRREVHVAAREGHVAVNGAAATTATADTTTAGASTPAVACEVGAGDAAVEVEGRRAACDEAEREDESEETRHARIVRQMLDASDRTFYGTEQMPRIFLALNFSVAVTRK